MVEEQEEEVVVVQIQTEEMVVLVVVNLEMEGVEQMAVLQLLGRVMMVEVDGEHLITHQEEEAAQVQLE
jgi:hypothetical protein|tara:strand:- start:224 stop:430 length:207 start_codon:yes stop_codon:yes gene_type:complete